MKISSEISEILKRFELGKKFELSSLKNISRRVGKEYELLKRLVKDLDDRQLIEQVQFCLPGIKKPCTGKGEYFIADQVWVKVDEFGDLDMVIVDAKLSKSTSATKNQEIAIKNQGQKFMYKTNKLIEYDYLGNKLNTDINPSEVIKLKGFYKLYGDGDKTFIGIETFKI